MRFSGWPFITRYACITFSWSSSPIGAKQYLESVTSQASQILIPYPIFNCLFGSLWYLKKSPQTPHFKGYIAIATALTGFSTEWNHGICSLDWKVLLKNDSYLTKVKSKISCAKKNLQDRKTFQSNNLTLHQYENMPGTVETKQIQTEKIISNFFLDG